jgi:hypothetical protein
MSRRRIAPIHLTQFAIVAGESAQCGYRLIAPYAEAIRASASFATSLMKS